VKARSTTMAASPSETSAPSDTAALLNLSEDEIWSLSKGELRRHFFALQRHARAIPLPQQPSSNQPPEAQLQWTSPVHRTLDEWQTGRPEHVDLQDLDETYQTLPRTESQPQQPRPSLLSLPIEVRRLIFRFLLMPPDGMDDEQTPLAPMTAEPRQNLKTYQLRLLQAERADKVKRERARGHFAGLHPRALQAPLRLSHTFPPALLRTSRQMHEEGVAALYGHPELTVHATVDYELWKHTQNRSDLVVGREVRQAIRNLHVHVNLGNENRASAARPKEGEAAALARLEVVKKGIRKLGKWLGCTPLLPGSDTTNDASRDSGPLLTRSDSDETTVSVLQAPLTPEEHGARSLHSLTISWREPQNTFTWEQKRAVLDEFRAMRPRLVIAGEINWGLVFPSRKYRFEQEYLRELVWPR
jgi:hypothetical protein